MERDPVEPKCPTCGCDGRRASQDRQGVWFFDFECGSNMWEGEPDTLEEAPACHLIALMRPIVDAAVDETTYGKRRSKTAQEMRRKATRARQKAVALYLKERA